VIAVDTDRLVQSFLALVQIDSVTYEERAIIERLASALDALGLAWSNDRTGRDGAGNLHARFPGSRSDLPPIMLCAHTDTVEPGRGVKPVLRDGIIGPDGRTALGADNKAGVAALLEAVRTIAQHNLPHRDVDLVLTWGEERQCRAHPGRHRAQLGARAGRDRGRGPEPRQRQAGGAGRLPADGARGRGAQRWRHRGGDHQAGVRRVSGVRRRGDCSRGRRRG
jgi:tripeptide aminopeptidase